MSNESKDKEKEEKEVTEAPKAEEGFTNIMERFAGIVKKFKIKNAEIVADHCAKGNLEDLEDVEARMREMGVHPSLVTQVVNFWADEIRHPIPKRLRKKMEQETGARTRGTREKESDEKYTVDPVSGVIRLAKEDERAVTLLEARQLQKLVKKDLADVEERESGDKKEPAFILGEKGAWTLNPKSRIGFGEFAVFQMYQDSLKKGEPIDPVEELARREEASVRLKEAMGVKAGGEDTEMNMLDKLEKLGMLKKTEGGEGAMLSQLDALGLLRKPGEEGRTNQLDMLDKLNTLGLMKRPDEGESATAQTMHALEAQVKELTDSLRKQEMDNVKSAVISLSNQLGELRKEMANQGRLEGRYALMEKAMTTIDGQLTGLRSDVRPLVDTLAHGGGGGPEPRIRTPEEKKKIAKGLIEATALEREAHALEDHLLFGKPLPEEYRQKIHGNKPAPPPTGEVEQAS